MISCPDCGTDNRDGSRFCGACGREFSALPEVTCPGCGSSNSAENVLCSDCLSPLQPPSEEAGGSAGGEPTGPRDAEDDAVASQRTDSEANELPVERETLVPLEEPAAVEPVEGPGLTEEAMPPATVADVGVSLEGGGEPREPLESVAGALPLENIMALPHRSESPPPQTVAVEGEEQAKLLSHVLISPRLGEEAHRLAVRSRVAVPNKVIRVALYVLLALAVAAPLIAGNHWLGTSTAARPSVKGLFGAIDSLLPGSTVLLSFDYDPGAAEELRPGVTVVLDHLLERRVSILALSTVPAGPPLAWQQLEQAALRAMGLSYGEDYLLLGYVPGQESALRRIAGGVDLAFPKDYIERKDTSEFALVRRASKLSDIALVITMAGDRIHVQRWLEQVQAPYGVPLAAVVSAAAEPALSCYYSSGQLRGMLAGLPATAEYETLRGKRGPASDTADAQAMAYLVIMVAALVGNIVHLFGGREPQGAGAETAPPDSGE